MGQLLHGSATTTAAVRRAIQHSQESLRGLAKRYGVNQKTIAKGKQRSSAADRPTGPRQPHSTSLSAEDEAIIVAFRRHTLLALDDCLYALQPSLPHLTRSSLHRCLQRHGVSRLPEPDSAQTAKKRFKSYPIGYFHIDIAEVHTEQGKLYLLVGIDRTSKFAFVELHARVSRRTAPTSSRPSSRPCRIACTPTMAPTSPRPGTSARPPQTSGSLSRKASCLGSIPSNMRARRPTSTTGSPSQGILGPTVRSNA